MHEICYMGATAMTRMMQAGQLSAREVLESHWEQIDRVNPTFNAIVTEVREQSMAAAKQADQRQAQRKPLGPLHGLPIAHKDLFETAGIRTTFGSPLFKDYVPLEDDPIVQRIRQAGAITIGKTNTPEFGAGSQTFNTLFGATRNPYDETKTCGGSSGGAAVALACGMMPIADGSDLGGSLRNPAAFCNVVGFRPSLGLIPDPKGSPLATAGPMARTVSDAALLLSVIAAPDQRFARDLGRDFHGVRVAWFDTLGGVPFDPRVRSVVDSRRTAFENLGCVVEQAEPDFEGAGFAFKTIRAWHSAQRHGELFLKHPGSYKDTLRQEIETGLRLSQTDLEHAEAVRSQLSRRFQTFLEKYEYFILPTTQVPPFAIEEPYPTQIDGVPMHGYIDWMKSCWYISVMGNPAISVPAGFTEGLPVGLQIVGRSNQDFSVLQLAQAFTAG